MAETLSTCVCCVSLYQAACKFVVEAHPVDGTQRLTNLAKADGDLGLGLDACAGLNGFEAPNDTATGRVAGGGHVERYEKDRGAASNGSQDGETGGCRGAGDAMPVAEIFLILEA